MLRRRIYTATFATLLAIALAPLGAAGVRAQAAVHASAAVRVRPVATVQSIEAGELQASGDSARLVLRVRVAANVAYRLIGDRGRLSPGVDALVLTSDGAWRPLTDVPTAIGRGPRGVHLLQVPILLRRRTRTSLRVVWSRLRFRAQPQLAPSARNGR